MLAVLCMWLAVCVPVSLAKPLVLVSVEPLALVVREVCADQCDVVTLVPRGVSEHGWQPGPKDMVHAKEAVAAIAVGLEFDENWIKKLGVSSNKTLWLGPALFPMGWWSDDMIGHRPGRKAATSHEEHSHTTNDPHIWTDAGRMAKAAELTADHISALMPTSAERIKANGVLIRDRLIQLQLNVDARRQHWRTRPVVVFHDVVGYFARRFNLPILAVATGGSGHDLSAKMIADVSRRFKDSRIAALMVERVDGAAKTLARELKTQVIQVDFAATEHYKNWDEWYLRLVQAWEDVLKPEGGR